MVVGPERHPPKGLVELDVDRPTLFERQPLIFPSPAGLLALHLPVVGSLLPPVGEELSHYDARQRRDEAERSHDQRHPQRSHSPRVSEPFR